MSQEIPVVERSEDRRRSMGGFHLRSALLIVPDVSVENSHHRRPQGTSSFPNLIPDDGHTVDRG
ncbi:hypothetical protein AB0I84_49640, partial [Streptomyces spectabilis]|uniref:hypothetical protein n=1 Tax=Streptomyces spectabilis TaxID=68270 RepID=UPI0034056937